MKLFLRFLLAAFLLGPCCALGQSKSVRPPPDPEAEAFVRALLAQRPAKEMSVSAVLHIRHADGRRTHVPAIFSVQLGSNAWRSTYQTERIPAMGPEELVVIHHLNGPNEYLFTQVSLDGARTNSLALKGDRAALSFAGSDFWLSDLGLEFLHWPQQRFVRDAKITMRWGRPLKIVESTNPNPGGGNYARVVSEIDAELGSVIRAQAYDTRSKRVKLFELRRFAKVNGHWQVKDMEIQSDQADTRTQLEFSFQAD